MKNDELYKKLVLADMDEQLPGNSLNKIDALEDEYIHELIAYASVLSLSDEYSDKALCYEIISRLIEVKKRENTDLLVACDLLLARIGNFPGRELLKKRYLDDGSFARSITTSLEIIAREAENTVDTGLAENVLTDFQYKLYGAVTQGRSITVSAPTSAGKSYVLNLALQNRIKSAKKESIIYVVPTRALITEVSQRIRSSLREAKVDGVIVRAAPFPVSKDDVKNGVIYVLTQERLSSLLHSEDEGLWLTSLIVDEAHEIQKRKRGVVLQNAIDKVLAQFPNTSVLFASPLISNPEYFLGLFKLSPDTGSIVEQMSPVTQNIILVDKVDRKTKQVDFHLVGREKNTHLGVREFNYKFRGGKSYIKSKLAIELEALGSTIVFCNGPSETETVALTLAGEIDDVVEDEEIAAFIDFIKKEVHSDYPLVKSLEKGVAFHYGDMPSIVRSGVESLFKSEKITYICCTSTLLQGVNLPAKNIIIENPKSGDDPMSRPDFLNLSGRAGRLLQEFHGNIWCLNSREWTESIYQGEPLVEIASATNLAMKDGGSIVGELLSNNITNEKDIEDAEIIYSRIFHEIATGGKDDVSSRYISDENKKVLEETLTLCEMLEPSLPYKILEAHKSIRPDQLDLLYKNLSNEIFLNDFIPMHPFQEGAKVRFESILEIICETFEWNIHPNYFGLLSYVAYEWVRGRNLGEMISNRVDYLRNEKKSDESTSSIIRQILKTIEKDIRFKLEKYFSAYNDILKYVCEEKELEDEEFKIEPYHIYLEFGAADKVSLNLMALGLSRFTAIKLSKYQVLKELEVDKPEEYLAALSQLHLNDGVFPKVCLNEIYDLIGNQ